MTSKRTKIIIGAIIAVFYLYALDAGYDAPDLILERIDALESSYE